MMVLTKIYGGDEDSYIYREWVYLNVDEWEWELTEYKGKAGNFISGVWLNEEDAIAFRLKFGL